MVMKREVARREWSRRAFPSSKSKEEGEPLVEFAKESRQEIKEDAPCARGVFPNCRLCC